MCVWRIAYRNWIRYKKYLCFCLVLPCYISSLLIEAMSIAGSPHVFPNEHVSAISPASPDRAKLVPHYPPLPRHFFPDV
jgi:hypothetical protein